ncbi:MAG TPA: metal ABC transporter ATP-binding protein [Thermotogota bacterium]|nr:metal ABC transporter ATP-binding protein [Thermotogota bacterium]HRW92263.1 metal ABC transporter ATP-binding protein [Thermotogota bacterium]
MEQNLAIELQGVWVYYGDQLALEDVHLKVKPLEMLSIIGPNGAGKSTLIKVLLGLVHPRRGSVRILGKPVSTARKEQLMGYVPQNTRFERSFPIRVLDVVLSGRMGGKMPLFHHFTPADREQATMALEKVEMVDHLTKQVSELSGGQLQRVLIARALVSHPKILLMDEPTASLDSSAREGIFSLLESLHEQVTIVVVTHDLSAISTYFESIACLNRTLHYHGGKELSQGVVDATYGCPVDLIAHGVSHRVLSHHPHSSPVQDGGEKHV